MPLVIAAVIGVTGWLVYMWALALTVPAGLDLFDFANNLLYANDMLHGNWLLHGWVVTQDPHWLTDDLLYVLGLWIRGVDPALLHAEPVVMYTILVALAAWASIVSLNLKGADRAVVIGLAGLPLVFPSSTLSSQVLVGPYHTGTAAVALGAILTLRPRDGTTPWRTRGAVAAIGGILLMIGRIGDPYMLSLGIVPIVLVTLYRNLVHPRPHQGVAAWLPLWAACAAWLAAAAALGAIPALGGFTMRASLAPFIPLSEVGQRLVSFIGSFLDLSGGNIFGMSMGSRLVFALARLAYLCAAVWTVISVLGRLRKGIEQDWTTTVLAVAILLSSVGTFLYGPQDYLGNEHRAPIFLLLGIVFARYIAANRREWLVSPSTRRIVVAGLVCGGLMFAVLPVQEIRHPQGFDDPSHFPQIVLARWLQQHGLRHGYGPYDSASIITVETREDVTVRPLIATSQYYSLPRSAWTLVPNIELMANSAWYLPDYPGTFLIVDNADVDEQTARQTFGIPDYVYRVGDFQVFTWDKGISCTLPPQVPGALAEERAGVPPHGASCHRIK